MENQPTIHPVESRVLALVRRFPGCTVPELTMRASGMTQDNLRSAIERLEKNGLVEREKTARVVFFVTDRNDDKPLPGRTKDIWTNYVPPKAIIARADALAHELVPSRRGDELSDHKPPSSMMQGKLADKRPHTTANLSPINSNTFCKQSPPVAKRPTIKKVRTKGPNEGFQRIYDDAKRAEVLELHAKGMSYQEAATAAGVSKASVKRWCSAAPKKTRQPADAAIKMPPKSRPTQMAFNAPRGNGQFRMAEVRA